MIQLSSRILLVLLAIVFSPLCMIAQIDNYGADQANKRFMPSQGMLGGRTDFNYLALENHPGNSGVPLGGIGVGNVEFAPDGRFARIGMNNIHIPIPRSKASFFSLWYKSGGEAKSYQLVRENKKQYGLEGVNKIFYKGIFPRAELNFGEEMIVVSPRIHAYSGLVPHDIKNSSLPVVFFEIELQAKQDAEVAIAFSWEDFIGRGLKEPKSIEGMDGQIFGGNGREKLVNGENWPVREPEQTFAESVQYGNFCGIRQFASGPLKPIKATFQNYVNEVVVLAEIQEGNEISYLPAYSIQQGEVNWNNFKSTGLFNKYSGEVKKLSYSENACASAISVKTKMAAGEKKTIRFMLAWFYPELKVNKSNAGSCWPNGSDYGRYFHNFFDNIEQLIQYTSDNRALILNETLAWQEPVLNSTLPDWYKFKLINSAYVIYTNMVLNKKGDVMVNEGGMGGLAGTMDQRISSHPFYQKFFTQLDRSEMEIFADAQAGDGSIQHFIGHYYVGMGTVGGRIPTENNWMLDNTGGWIIQLAKDYEQTGDIQYLKKYIGRVKDGMAFLKRKMPEGLNIPIGPTTYDDYKHPPVYSYGISMYLATLKAAEALAKAVNDTTWLHECKTQFELSKNDMIRMLWNGRFFSYGCEIDGSNRLDSILFTGQLAGQFVSRYCGWGDILPIEVIQASIIAQFKTSLYNTPDYYANKVWNINAGRGIDNQGSQCWPFYLESYTAYTAMQTGYVEDALDIMRHIQLVHLRKGWTWCQNLWNPAELNYMTAPVTWFSTDLIAGAGINIPRKELRLAPAIIRKDKTVLPLFYPTFWAELTLDSKKKNASLKILKTFGSKNISFNKIIIEPVGKPTAERKEISIDEFSVQQGNVLDISRWWKELMSAEIREAVLPQADKVPFIVVDNNLYK